MTPRYDDWYSSRNMIDISVDLLIRDDGLGDSDFLLMKCSPLTPEGGDNRLDGNKQLTV